MVVHILFDKVESDSRVKATIDVQTIIIPESFSAFYGIAQFSEVVYAKESFEKLAKYKGAKIIERDKEFWARREFDWI